MHNYTDEMRVMAELQTFTADDLCSALDCPLGTAQSILAIIARKRLVERVRVSHSFLYTLSTRGRAIVAKLPEIDPNERVMQLEWIVGSGFPYAVPDCPNCGTTGLWQSWHGNDNTAYGKWYCPICRQINQYVDADDDLPF